MKVVIVIITFCCAAILSGYYPTWAISPELAQLHQKINDLSKLESNKTTTYEVCVIARSHIGQHSSWGAFALSLFSAASKTNSRISVTFVDTDLDPSRNIQGIAALMDFIERIQPMISPDLLHLEVSPLTHTDAIQFRQNLRIPDSKPDFGYILTDLVLESILSLPQRQCHYLIFTNADNLYGSALLSSTAAARQSNTDIVGMFMSSHHDWPAVNPAERAGRNVLLRSELRSSGIDLGAVFYRTEHLRNHPDLRFFKVAPPNSFFAADGGMIDKAKIGASTIVIPEILFLHQ